MTADLIRQRLAALSSKSVASNLGWFFKTGPGEYGEGDKFLGVKVPQSRSVAKEFQGSNWATILELSKSEYHEERFCALAILTNQYEKAKDKATKADLFDKYLSLYETGAVNNWDLVDATATRFGKELIGDSEAIEFLLSRARDNNLWVQRSAVILTFPLIAEYELLPTLVICEELIDHEHDLIQKAVGWALREAGKKDLKILREFLEQHSASMPRTALRYAIEKMSERERRDWLSRKSLAQQGRGH
ncbi:MAG: DNA alkylation repair protein [Aquiluna sp.]|nr:DNA alkylation repair protein [Aquiluna sp.]MCF8545756.1 DNA alkylation repair protein [Aquiluna sp.]